MLFVKHQYCFNVLHFTIIRIYPYMTLSGSMVRQSMFPGVRQLGPPLTPPERRGLTARTPAIDRRPFQGLYGK